MSEFTSNGLVCANELDNFVRGRLALAAGRLKVQQLLGARVDHQQLAAYIPVDMGDVAADSERERDRERERERERRRRKKE